MNFSRIPYLRGGTFVTNFSKKDKYIYDEVIHRYGKEDLKISLEAYSNDGFLLRDHYSIHMSRDSNGDLSKFWSIYKQVKEEKNGREIIITFMDGTRKTFNEVKEVQFI